MIPKYIATLSVAVFLCAAVASSLEFVTRSQVLSGKTVDEALQFEFTIDADSSHTYEINPVIAQFLRDHVSFHTQGPAHVLAAKIEITPKEVSWTENRRTITSTGAAMTAQLHWDTAENSANGAHGYIYLDFPQIPGLEGKTPVFHSGGYQIDDAGRYLVREVTTYQNTFLLSLARFLFALSAGLPFGILLHSIWWAFVLNSEKRSRLEQFPLQGSGFPRTFYPNPVAEWRAWVSVLLIGAVLASVIAGIPALEGFMSSSFMLVPYIIVAIAAAIAIAAAHYTAKSVLTVRVNASGISYARGRGDLQWLDAPWTGILRFTEKSRTNRGRTTHWIELEFSDGRKKLKIRQSIEGYAALRDMLRNVFTAERPEVIR